MATHQDRIIDYLQTHPDGATDGELTEALDIKWHQTVNQECRLLESLGVLSRDEDPDLWENRQSACERYSTDNPSCRSKAACHSS